VYGVGMRSKVSGPGFNHTACLPASFIDNAQYKYKTYACRSKLRALKKASQPIKRLL